MIEILGTAILYVIWAMTINIRIIDKKPRFRFIEVFAIFGVFWLLRHGLWLACVEWLIFVISTISLGTLLSPLDNAIFRIDTSIPPIVGLAYVAINICMSAYFFGVNGGKLYFIKYGKMYKSR